ncbi:MAG TPA: RpiB/LacA/LacB family sugar-phosphate isomerase, partial [Chitinophagales bacterium]|nr:RpiB/LacA/LacB family sugar-phosphate isomerase [Chitinophagales bacterium]
MNFPSKIVIGSDHAGFDYKTEIIEFLKEKNVNIIDVGTNSDTSCDYPDYAHALAEKIENNEVEMGILLCGSANGVAM